MYNTSDVCCIRGKSGMITKGITLEKITISWVQMLSAAFVVGAGTYMATYSFTKLTEMEVAQKELAPIVTLLVDDYERRAEADEKFANALQELNNTLLRLESREEGKEHRQNVMENTLEKHDARIRSLELSK